MGVEDEGHHSPLAGLPGALLQGAHIGSQVQQLRQQPPLPPLTGCHPVPVPPRAQLCCQQGAQPHQLQVRWALCDSRGEGQGEQEGEGGQRLHKGRLCGPAGAARGAAAEGEGVLLLLLLLLAALCLLWGCQGGAGQQAREHVGSVLHGRGKGEEGKGVGLEGGAASCSQCCQAAPLLPQPLVGQHPLAGGSIARGWDAAQVHHIHVAAVAILLKAAHAAAVAAAAASATQSSSRGSSSRCCSCC